MSDGATAIPIGMSPACQRQPTQAEIETVAHPIGANSMAATANARALAENQASARASGRERNMAPGMKRQRRRRVNPDHHGP